MADVMNYPHCKSNNTRLCNWKTDWGYNQYLCWSYGKYNITLKLWCYVRKIYTDVASGAKSQRPGLDKSACKTFINMQSLSHGIGNGINHSWIFI